MIAYIAPIPTPKRGYMMDTNMIQELIHAANIPDNDAAVTALLAKVKPMIDRELYLQLENSINLRVSEMQTASFAAGMIAGAAGHDVRHYTAELSADLEALRGMLGDALLRQRQAILAGVDSKPAADEVAAILAEYRQKRRQLEELDRAWGMLPGYIV